MDHFEKVILTDDQKKTLPLFYNFVHYKKLDSTFYNFSPPYSERLRTYAIYSQANKLISKIVDFSQIEEE
ncbi:hypothetical protein HDE70_002376 [Pedobacter cryoconitis]|nr:hypothetical protein [Pedobacter cryoconitis]